MHTCNIIDLTPPTTSSDYGKAHLWRAAFQTSQPESCRKKFTTFTLFQCCISFRNNISKIIHYHKAQIAQSHLAVKSDFTALTIEQENPILPPTLSSRKIRFYCYSYRAGKSDFTTNTIEQENPILPLKLSSRKIRFYCLNYRAAISDFTAKTIEPENPILLLRT